MSNFKIGDIVKRENDKNIYEIVNISGKNRRFGDIMVKNLDTGVLYLGHSEGGRTRMGTFMIHFKDFKPKKFKYSIFDFKNGI